MLSRSEIRFLTDTAKRSEHERVLQADMKPEIRARIDSLVERGYCKFLEAMVMGRSTGDKIIAITEAGEFVLRTLAEQMEPT